MEIIEIQILQPWHLKQQLLQCVTELAAVGEMPVKRAFFDATKHLFVVQISTLTMGQQPAIQVEDEKIFAHAGSICCSSDYNWAYADVAGAVSVYG